MGELLVDHAAAFRACRLVEPSSEFFPDEIDVSADGMETLLHRLTAYTPLPDDVPLRLQFIERESEGGKSCSSGACGPEDAGLLPPLGETEDEYIVPLDVSVTRNPVRLTTALSRSLGALILVYTDTEVEDLSASGEIAAVLSGLGVLLLNGSAYFMKGCGGAKMFRGTQLSVEELAVATAFAARVFGYGAGRIKKHLATTQGEAFADAWAFAEQNDELVQMLKDAPEIVAAGTFSFAESRGLLGKLFGRGDRLPLDGAAAAKRARSPEEERRRAEVQALMADVDDALAE